jgi:hypothetical protein
MQTEAAVCYKVLPWYLPGGPNKIFQSLYTLSSYRLKYRSLLFPWHKGEFCMTLGNIYMILMKVSVSS